MNSYRKRAQSGWCKGKGYKNESNRSERNFSSKEISEQLGFVKPTPSKRRARETSLSRKIKRLARSIRFYLNFFQKGIGNCSIKMSFLDEALKTQKELKAILKSPEFLNIQFKNRQEIKELSEVELRL